MRHLPRRLPALACVSLAAVTLLACGTAVSTSKFKGEEHEVAQAIANLQSDTTAGEQGKVCGNDLASSVVARLGGRAGCESAVKGQLTEIDNPEATVESVRLDATARTATATVKSIVAGKSKLKSVTLVKEGGRWRISAVA